MWDAKLLFLETYHSLVKLLMPIMQCVSIWKHPFNTWLYWCCKEHLLTIVEHLSCNATKCFLSFIQRYLLLLSDVANLQGIVHSLQIPDEVAVFSFFLILEPVRYSVCSLLIFQRSTKLNIFSSLIRKRTLSWAEKTHKKFLPLNVSMV